MPRMRCLVVWGFGLTMLILRANKAFNSVDLPTLGRPTMATNPQRNSLPGAPVDCGSSSAVMAGFTAERPYADKHPTTTVLLPARRDADSDHSPWTSIPVLPPNS